MRWFAYLQIWVVWLQRRVDAQKDSEFRDRNQTHSEISVIIWVNLILRFVLLEITYKKRSLCLL